MALILLPKNRRNHSGYPSPNILRGRLAMGIKNAPGFRDVILVPGFKLPSGAGAAKRLDKAKRKKGGTENGRV